jgi:single-stranded-DNA-specific exonuclease
MPAKRWLLAPPASPDYLRQFRGLHPILAQVLINRGLDDPQAAARFLYAKEDGFNPFQLKGVSKAVGRIRQALKKNEPIAVYGDFDADGVTSTALLVMALRMLKADVHPYIPKRLDEGYGLNTPALIELARRGIRLVITVDCGIRSVQEVEDGKAAGLDIIVTDHHSLGPEIPDAYAVINPKQDGEDPLMWAGVGVAYCLASALFKAEHMNGRNGRSAPQRPDALIDLVAIGTVADLMPLNRLENRLLVRRGLELLNRANRPGVRALLDVAGVQPGSVTAQTIGFAIGPRINAAGRLDDAMLAYHLLTAPDIDQAAGWAAKLQQLNTQRQDKTRAAQEAIRQRLDEQRVGEMPLIFAGDRSFEPGIVGLVAGRLTEEYFRPAVVLEEGDGESRASCRSIPQFDITRALDQCADLLVRHGGHALAAGFTVMNENIPVLRDRLMQLAYDSLNGQDLAPTLDIDAELDLHQLHESLVKEMELLEPCGHGNPMPVFMIRNVHVAESRTLKDGRHLKLKISRASLPPLDAIGFGLGDWAERLPERIDIAFRLELNEWQGRTSLQANLQDIRAAERD